MEKVVLVDEKDNVIGFAETLEAHKEALLHRAFSVFIFNTNGEMLLQQRAHTKYHSGGLWTNACCSHPQPNETAIDAAQRRLQEEMGFATLLIPAFEFIYKASFDNGLTEYEYDHVFVGSYNGIIHPNKEEVNDYCYKNLDEIDLAIQQSPSQYTEWFKIAFPKLKIWLQNNAYKYARA